MQAELLWFISPSPSTHIPVQWGDVFVTGYILPPLPNAVAQHQLSGSSCAALTQVPDPCSRVSRADGNNQTQRESTHLKSIMPRCAKQIIGSKFTGLESKQCLLLDTDPEASRSLTGFQAQMKTSDSWPRSTMALLAGISTALSTSIMSEWWSVKGKGRNTFSAMWH